MNPADDQLIFIKSPPVQSLADTDNVKRVEVRAMMHSVVLEITM